MLDDLLRKWADNNLVTDEQATGRHWEATFIEEVGAASAENVRSAALRRWMKRHPEAAVVWLQSVTDVKLDSSKLHVEREHVARSDCRIDLRVWDGEHTVFIEVKWASPPSDEQMQRYRTAVAESDALVLLSPISHVVGPKGESNPNVHFTDWEQLAGFVQSTDIAKDSVEYDLCKTLLRWEQLVSATRAVVNKRKSAIHEFSEVIRWIEEERRAEDAELAGYLDLFRQLILTELAEAVASELPGWRRCLTNKGDHGDFQADLCLHAGGWQPYVPDPTYGVSTVLRLHGYADFSRIDVQIGTALVPYLRRAQKREWRAFGPEDATAVLQHLALVRANLWTTLRGADLKPIGSPNTEESWKCAYSESFFGDEPLQTLIARATSLAAIIKSAAAGSK